MSAELLESLEPIIAGIAGEFGRRHKVHGAEAEDFHQELRIWVWENADKITEWFNDMSEESATKMVAKSMRNEALDYGLDVKSQALGYDRNDLYFYSKGELKALLPAVFDPEKWLEPPQSEGRSTKSAAEGGNWVATLADVARALKKLSAEDYSTLVGFHSNGWSNKMIADSEGLSESVVSYRHDRAITRLLKLLGDAAPDPMRTQSTRDPWRGRHSISNTTARAVTGSTYE